MYCVKSPCKQYLPTFNFLDFKLLFEHWTLAPVRFRQTKRRSHSRRPSFVCSLFYLISIFLLFFFVSFYFCVTPKPCSWFPSFDFSRMLSICVLRWSPCQKGRSQNGVPRTSWSHMLQISKHSDDQERLLL